MDERLVVGSPVGDFERLFCHVISLQDQECGDLILTTAKSSIYSTKPVREQGVSNAGTDTMKDVGGKPFKHFSQRVHKRDRSG